MPRPRAAFPDRSCNPFYQSYKSSNMDLKRLLRTILLIAAALSAMAPGRAHADIVGAAFVQDDGSLQVKNHTIRLYGIYIPPTNRTCREAIRPIQCSPRAALALDFKIQGFVRCVAKGRNDDGSINAQCWVNYTPFSQGDDLSAYLISEGWAAALPGAPYAYHVLEKIARRKSLGVWGIAVDAIIPSP